MYVLFFFFNDTATTEIYTLSLHDALPIWSRPWVAAALSASCSPRLKIRTETCPVERKPTTCAHPRRRRRGEPPPRPPEGTPAQDRKSTRLNSSHANISYAVFCLKKK